MPIGDIRLDANLISNMLRHSSPAPPLHTNNVQLRKTRHTDILPSQKSPVLFDVHWDPPSRIRPHHLDAALIVSSTLRSRHRRTRAFVAPNPAGGSGGIVFGLQGAAVRAE